LARGGRLGPAAFASSGEKDSFMRPTTCPLIAVQEFVRATRDTGYKSTASAIAELIDNAFEAEANVVDVALMETYTSRGVTDICVRVTDDGVGIPANTLRVALQFGGSTRFGARTGTGRYGMGLPNGALSQARRVDVFSRTTPGDVWTSYLDADEIAAGQMRTVPVPRRAGERESGIHSRTGTEIVLTKCDRLDSKRVKALIARIRPEFGRIFRKFLYAGKRIRVNGVAIRPIDPLFLHTGDNLTGAHVYGPPLEYVVRVPEEIGWRAPTSPVTVRFSELPIDRWHELSNEEKNDARIAKHAGVSILRADREIDYGWFFMGSKRKENYDDWWRCEVSFSPELDDLFGVTHSKQKINPTDTMVAILTPDIERIARELNARVRKKYAAIRTEGAHSRLLKAWQAKDHLLEPPKNGKGSSELNHLASDLLRKRGEGVLGLRFAIEHESAEHTALCAVKLDDGRLSIALNENHPFFSKTYSVLVSNKSREQRNALQHTLLIILAIARTECMMSSPKERAIMSRFHQIWSDTVAAFLS
jgi:hypothetical protein